MTEPISRGAFLRRGGIVIAGLSVGKFALPYEDAGMMGQFVVIEPSQRGQVGITS